MFSGITDLLDMLHRMCNAIERIADALESSSIADAVVDQTLTLDRMVDALEDEKT